MGKLEQIELELKRHKVVIHILLTGGDYLSHSGKCFTKNDAYDIMHGYHDNDILVEELS